jgi:anhydro-N-acetylmuramic acid kinase
METFMHRSLLFNQSTIEEKMTQSVTLKNKKYRCLGLMSGTSLDGIDLAYLETDGHQILKIGPSSYRPYYQDFRDRLSTILGQSAPTDQTKAIEQELTDRHIEVIKDFMKDFDLSADDIDLIGFHGQTIYHNPLEKKTWQIGDAQKMANHLGIDVVGDFRIQDVESGGQGAPLVPIFHLALASQLQCQFPICMLNIGGVANVTYIPNENPEEMVAFDTGPGNALLDDWCLRYFQKAYDENGSISKKGKCNQAIIDDILSDTFFQSPVPKSLDRLHFHAYLEKLQNISPEDGAATLLGLTVQSMLLAFKSLPAMPKQIILMGGGRKNANLVDQLKAALPQVHIQSIDDLGLNGDFIEAEAFAYLAGRHMAHLPYSFPKTTGVSQPMMGGKCYKPDVKDEKVRANA